MNEEPIRRTADRMLDALAYVECMEASDREGAAAILSATSSEELLPAMTSLFFMELGEEATEKIAQLRDQIAKLREADE